MRVFISTFGRESQAAGTALARWMIAIHPSTRILTSGDLGPGAERLDTLRDAICEARFAVACLTRENVHAAPIHLEIGAALTGTREGVVVLRTATLRDVPAPLDALVQFSPTRQGMGGLAQWVNRVAGPDAVTIEELARRAEAAWTQLARSHRAKQAKALVGDFQVDLFGRHAAPDR